jgi:hypothetical protein
MTIPCQSGGLELRIGIAGRWGGFDITRGNPYRAALLVA